MHPIIIRPVHEHEWREVRELRLRALRDEVAPIAFVDTFATASGYADDFWQARTTRAALEAGANAPARQFVAITEQGDWVGSLTVLIERAGEADFAGEVAERDGGGVVGVYLDGAYRGAGVIQQLLDAAAAWVRERGLGRLRLHVHTDNLRAQRAYEKAGFHRTGVNFAGVVGPEIEMAREV